MCDKSADVYEEVRKASYYTSVPMGKDLCKERTKTQSLSFKFNIYVLHLAFCVGVINCGQVTEINPCVSVVHVA